MSNTKLRIGSEARQTGKHIHNKNWSDTSLGPIDDWPRSLRSMLNICLASNAPAGICWGNDLIFIYNDAWKNLIENEHPSPLGQPVRKVISDNQDQRFIELLDEVLETGEPSIGKNMKVNIHRHSNADQPTEKESIEFVFQPLHDSDGSLTGIFVQGIGLTERRHAKKELESVNQTLEERVKERTKKLRSYKRKLQLLASKLNKAEERERERLASELHDKLGQMLTVAKIKADGLKSDEFSDETSAEIQELREMIDDALGYNQNLMAELKPPAELDEEDVTEVLYRTAEKMKEQGLNVVIEDDKQPKPADREIRTMLYQSVRELLLNIIKHADVNEARMTISRTENQIKVTIEDEGRGFEMENDKPAPTEEGEFGLFNIQERINWHGGTFDIHSETGKGTKAVLHAPLKKEKAEQPVEEEPLPVPSEEEIQEELQKKINVLLVDDHDMMRRGLRQMIEREVDLTIMAEASDGEEAVKLARKKTPDVIVMDINMPVMDGIKATQKIKAEMPGIRIIGLSLHDSKGVIEDMRSAGASAYLTKNEAFETLCATIRSEMTSVKK